MTYNVLRTALGFPELPVTYRLGGWQCPSCLHCFSPSVTECPHCPPPQSLGIPEPGTGTAEPPHRLPDAASCPCQPSAEGGLCGCEEDSDAPPGPCTSFNCSC